MSKDIKIDEHGISSTAYYVCAQRARETERSDRIIVDPYARVLAGEVGKIFLEQMDLALKFDEMQRNSPVLQRFMAYRTFILDSLLLKAIKENNIKQVVNIACGLDTRPYRLQLENTVQFFELDFPAVIRRKQQVLQGIQPNPKPTCALHSIEVDLTESHWKDTLIKNGFEPTKPCVFITEGLLYYLTQEQIRTLLVHISQLSSVNSYIIGDMFSPKMMETSPMKIFVDMLNKYDTKIVTWSDNFAEVLKLFGWEGDNLLIDPSNEKKYSKRSVMDIPAKYMFWGKKVTVNLCDCNRVQATAM